jgi:urea transport system permease protein
MNVADLPLAPFHRALVCPAITWPWQLSAADLASAITNSLSLGSILTLTALGLAITFGVMRVINMAHGEMLMLGAYTTLVVTDEHYLGWSFFFAIPIAFVVVAFVGYLLEVGLVRFLYGRPLDTLLATWGVGMIFQQLVLLKFEANLQPMHMPEILDDYVPLGKEVNIPIYRIFIVGITALCCLLVYLWFYRTSFGLKSRAVVQNRPMASALGISTRWVDSLTFAFASGLAGVAGCILSPLYTVKYNMGADYIVEAFMVVILGGVGQLSGSVAGGAVIGTGDSFVEKILGDTSMAKVVVLLVVIAIIMIRPSGLFTRKERSYE